MSDIDVFRPGNAEYEFMLPDGPAILGYSGNCLQAQRLTNRPDENNLHVPTDSGHGSRLPDDNLLWMMIGGLGLTDC